MTNLKLKVSAKKLDNKVNYKGINDVQVFHNGNVEQEVMEQELSATKKLNKWGIFGSALGATLIPLRISAETITGGNTELAQDAFSPQKIFQYGLTIGITGLGVSFAIAMVMFIYTGVLRMLKQRQKSKEWTTDIIKGFVHCLVAIPTIFALYYLSTDVFGSLFNQLSGINETFLNMP